MKKSNVVYIPEVKEFIIDGKVIKETELTTEECQKYKQLAVIQPLLFGADEMNDNKQVIV